MPAMNTNKLLKNSRNVIAEEPLTSECHPEEAKRPKDQDRFFASLRMTNLRAGPFRNSDDSETDSIHPVKASYMSGVENPAVTPELMALEEQFRMITSIFENASEGIMIMDANGAIRCVNPALCATTGYSVGDLVGKTPAMLKSGGHKEAFHDGIWESLGGTGKWRGKVWNKRKNGEIYPTWFSISAIMDSSGRVSQYMGISVDMTGERDDEEQMDTSPVAGAVL